MNRVQTADLTFRPEAVSAASTQVVRIAEGVDHQAPEKKAGRRYQSGHRKQFRHRLSSVLLVQCH